MFKSNRCYRSLPLNFRSTRRKLYEIVQSGVIHNLIGQINSNQGRFDRKSIKRHELSCRVRSSHFSFLSVQRPFKYLLRALAIFRNQRKLIFRVGEIFINCFFLNFPFTCFNLTGAERHSQVGAWHEGARTTVVVYLQKYDPANRSTFETAKSVKSLGLKDNATNQIRMKIYSVHIQTAWVETKTVKE